MYGRRLVLPADLYTCPPEQIDAIELTNYPAGVRDTLRELHRVAYKNLVTAGQSMKQRYDQKAKVTPYTEGDVVWFYNPVRKIGRNPKLQRPWESGWLITKVINDILVRIERGRKKRCVHVDRIAPDERWDDPLASPCFLISLETIQEEDEGAESDASA